MSGNTTVIRAWLFYWLPGLVLGLSLGVLLTHRLGL